MIGETIGNFQIIRQLGRGGMGEVWLGEHKDIKTKVAIKVLLPQISADKQHVQRFFNEAIAVSKIKHAGIAKIFDVGFHARGEAYLVMEFLDGETLSSRIKRSGRLPLGQLADVARQIASVLAATHDEGITHRDLKPDNAFLVRDAELASGERVKLLDFGIAKLSGVAGGLTGSAGSMGTPGYMSPEQWQNSAKVDHRADVYSLGCVVFEMACGRLPFVAASIGEACHMHLDQVPPAACSIVPELPAELDELIARLLAKQPEQRPAMRELIPMFAAIGAGQPGQLDETQLPGGAAAPKRASTPIPIIPMIPMSPVTTFSGAAGALLTKPAPRSTWKWMMGLAGTLGIGALVAGVALRGGGDPPDVPPAAQPAPTSAPITAPPTPAPITPPAPAPITRPAPAPVAIPAPVAPAPIATPAPAPKPPAHKVPPKVTKQPVPPASPHETEIEHRLESLKRLHDDGTINDAEYNRRRAAALKDL